VIVVTDTSALNYLVLVGQVDVLPALFDEIHAPEEVVREFQDERAPEAVRVWVASLPPWLRVSRPAGPFTAEPRIHAGEAHAVALAMELGATTVVIDERHGREFARRQGLTVVGTLSILELAAERGLVDLPIVIRALQQTSFRIARSHIEAALARDAERKRR